ncbi:MAG: hypothetical protein ACKV1O_19680 [Saprospiraceae bacterium]
MDNDTKKGDITSNFPNSARTVFSDEELDVLIGKLRRKAAEDNVPLPIKNASSKKASEYEETANHINQILNIKEGGISKDDLWYFHYEYHYSDPGDRRFNAGRKKAVDWLYAYITNEDASYTRERYVKDHSNNDKITRGKFISTSVAALVTGSLLGIGATFNYMTSKHLLEWNLVTPWVLGELPESFEATNPAERIIRTNRFAIHVANFVKRINKKLEGILKIRIYNELQTPPEGSKRSILEVYDLLRDNNTASDAVHMVHASPYYRMLSSPKEGNPPNSRMDIDWSLPYFFFSAIPFGMEDEHLEKWIGKKPEEWTTAKGYELWKKLYRSLQTEIEVFPSGMTSKQNSGWWRLPKQLGQNDPLWEMDMPLFRSTLENQEVRIVGFARHILEERYGVIANQYPSSELLLQMHANKELVLAEWINASEDMAIGLHTTPDFKHYCVTNWNELSTLIEMSIKRKALDELPKEARTVLINELGQLHQDIADDFRKNVIKNPDMPGIRKFNLSREVTDKLLEDTVELLFEWYQNPQHPEINREICRSYIDHLKQDRTNQLANLLKGKIN